MAYGRAQHDRRGQLVTGHHHGRPSAKRGRERWIIEVKGPGSLPAMRVNYFLAMLGEVLQRMDDADVKYSIALPDLKQYRGLWARLPALAKARTTISLLLVDTAGHVEILR